MDALNRITKESQLIKELRKMDICRDHLRAQFADLYLEETGTPEAIAKRKARREKEYARFG
jgi:hypothetical protein